jgi:hypothetical protein
MANRLSKEKACQITIKGKDCNRLIEGPISEVKAISAQYQAMGETITEVVICQA